MKKIAQAFGKKMTAAKLALVGCLMLAAGQASAELPTWAGSAATALGGSVGDFEGLVGPIILAVTVALVGIKLFKRFTAKI